MPAGTSFGEAKHHTRRVYHVPRSGTHHFGAPNASGDAILQKTTYTFDVSVWEIFWWSFYGAKLVLLAPGGEKDPAEISNTIEKYQVNVMHFVPSMFESFLLSLKMEEKESKNLESLKYIFTSGEALKPEQVKMFHEYIGSKQSTILANFYGPTEASIDVTYYTCYEVTSVVPIGKPINNMRIYMMNEGNLCGIGLPGELCIAGVGLAQGYLNRPELTKEKFIDNPFGAGKLYRTGDLAKWQANGDIEYLGRIDEQVKIRGMRIELGEIESQIRSFEHIEEVAVIAREDASGDKSLYAYFTAPMKMEIEGIRSHLSKFLPSYMVPSYMMQIDAIPKTKNGKLDKRSLPEIKAQSSSEYVKPTDNREESLCNSFGAILGLERVGIYDNFYELGGDSIKAIRIVSKMRENGYKVTVKDIMQHHTPFAIAKHVTTYEINQYDQKEVVGEVKKTPIVQAFQEWKLPVTAYFNQAIMLKIGTDNEERLHKVFAALGVHHDMLRAIYKENKLVVQESKEHKGYELSTYDLTVVDNLEERIPELCSKLQSSFDIEKGPLFKAALFRTKNGFYLMMCAHHLIVDTVSWSILVDDFNTAMIQAEHEEEISLPAKTASYQAWAELLEEYKEEDELQEELQYWTKIDAAIENARLVEATKDDHTPKVSFNGLDVKAKTIQLSKQETDWFLHKTAKAFHTEANDILISALGLAVSQLTKQKNVAVGMEGHGREHLHKEIDIDRTVGWFTSVYPIIVPCCEEVTESIIETKEMLHSIPNHGIGYGVLKGEQKKNQPDIFFNYLGDTDKVSGGVDLTFSTGNRMARENKLAGNVNITGQIKNQVLQFEIRYVSGLYTEEFISRFTDLYKEALVREIEYCVNAKQSVKTPSDYSEKGLTREELKNIYGQINAENISDITMLAPLQEGILYHSIQEENKTCYVIQNVYEWSGDVNILYIQKAVQLLSDRHESLRTVLLYRDLEEPRQIVLKERQIEVEVLDLSGLTLEEQEKKKNEILTADVERGFDFETDSLIRFKLLDFGENKYYFVLTIHHVIMDGWCIDLILRDFFEFYEQLCSQRQVEDLKKQIQEEKHTLGKYSEYVKLMKSNDNALKEYWEERLSDYVNYVQLEPLEEASGGQEHMKRIGCSVSRELTEQFTTFAKQNHITINTIVEMAWGILLKVFNRVDDVIYGKVVSGRNVEISGIEDMIGLFANTVPVRIQFDEKQSVQEFLQNHQKEENEASGHCHGSLLEICKNSILGSKLIQTLLVFENYGSDYEKDVVINKDSKVSLVLAREETSYPITIMLNLKGGVLNYDIMYNPNKYTECNIRYLLEVYGKILEQLTLAPTAHIADLNVFTEEHLQLVRTTFNETFVPRNSEDTVVSYFKDTAKKNSNQAALIFGKETMTYEMFDYKTNQLAEKLIGLGVKTNDYVAVLADRSFEMLIGIYGVLKAGGAYVPIVPDYPTERIQYILGDCKPKVVLTYKVDVETDIPVIKLEENREWTEEGKDVWCSVKQEDVAYCIYTSGTTGNPKGVPNTHGSLNNLLHWMQEDYPLRSGDKLLLKTTFVFDVSTTELFWWSYYGGTLVILPPDAEKEPYEVLDIVESEKIRMLNFVPSMLSAFLASIQDRNTYAKKLQSLTYIMAAGEALNVTVAEQFFSIKEQNQLDMRLINIYGPTETCVYATVYECKAGDKKIPIGKPIHNTQLCVLNQNQECGIGMPGELCISGVGVAKGYLNLENLTNEKFVDSIFGKTKMYHTGDLVKWLPNGNIEYLGRIDQQVKVRGFRIELGEIESVLRKLDGVKEATVIVREGDNLVKEICAYLVTETHLEEELIKDALCKHLPDYMIPSYFMELKEIPLTKNGKLNRNALPEIQKKAKEDYIAATTKEERIIEEAYQEVLNVEKISIKEDFISLGGDSIKAIRVVSKLRKNGYQVLVKEIMELRTIEKVARVIKKIKENENSQEEVSGEITLSPIMNWFFELNLEHPEYFNQSFILSTERFDEEALQAAFKEIVIRHDMLRAVWSNQKVRIRSTKEGELYTFIKHDISGIEEKELRNYLWREGNKVQESIDLELGPIVKLVLFTHNGQEYLLIVIHHIAVDGVSWRILIDDFKRYYGEYLSHKRITPMEKTCSYQTWTGSLERLGESSKALSEIKYWQGVQDKVKESHLACSKDMPYEKETATFQVSKELTNQLVYESKKAYNTEVKDLLITAMAMATKEIVNQSSVVLELEGHGREDMGMDLAIDRTVGWFTSKYPIVVELGESLEENIIHTKEMIRHIPNKGALYGTLKYLGKIERIEEPDILFNYLGDFSESQEGNTITISNFIGGETSHRNNKLGTQIIFDGMLENGQLTFQVEYDLGRYQKSMVDDLIKKFTDSLELVVKHCCNKEKEVKTVSDFGLKNTSNKDFNKALSKLKNLMKK